MISLGEEATTYYRSTLIFALLVVYSPLWKIDNEVKSSYSENDHIIKFSHDSSVSYNVSV